MHALYNLRDMLCKELKSYGSRGDLTAGSLSTIDTLAHALKNVDKIIEVREGVEEGSVEAYREFFRQMHNLSDSAPDERTRASINRIIQEMQQG